MRQKTLRTQLLNYTELLVEYSHGIRINLGIEIVGQLFCIPSVGISTRCSLMA